MIANNFGKLYLVPNLLGSTKPEQVLPAGTLAIVKQLKHFVVENTRTSRRVLSRIGMDCSIDDIEFIELDKHNARNLDLMEHLGACLQGEDMGLMSEAGTPCVADPGALVVDFAHSAGIQVIPLVGPNAMILALMASGFNGQAFAFHGYLPIKSPERQNAIRIWNAAQWPTTKQSFSLRRPSATTPCCKTYARTYTLQHNSVSPATSLATMSLSSAKALGNGKVIKGI